ncbi:hypothetical protein ACFQ0M_48230 [Kitasatospora aburaviensis]|uniref:HTH cro/C1-type domain-containing protein n=1 Tax=Kitasatospora aburaviensis TaxID=67265 RepID=A0ABW1EXP2_9ACTN
MKIENARRDPNDPVSLAELAKRSGGVLSESTLRSLYNGRRSSGIHNPTVETLHAVGRLFGLTDGAAYFTSDAQAAAVDRQLEALNSLTRLRGPVGAVDGADIEAGDTGLGILARATTTLSPGGYSTWVEMTKRLLKLEESFAQQADS